jgi:hypothetical protein
LAENFGKATANFSIVSLEPTPKMFHSKERKNPPIIKVQWLFYSMEMVTIKIFRIS